MAGGEGAPLEPVPGLPGGKKFLSYKKSLAPVTCLNLPQTETIFRCYSFSASSASSRSDEKLLQSWQRISLLFNRPQQNPLPHRSTDASAPPHAAW